MRVSPKNFSDLRTLIIEDQDDVRALIREMVEEIGVSDIYEASNVEQAKDVLARPEDINLVLCDWNMPGQSGFDLLQDINKSDPDLPFIMITGRSDMESIVSAKSSGVTAYIRKPFTPEQLEAKIHIILNRTAKKAGLEG